MIIDLSKYREEKDPYISEQDAWDLLINLSASDMLIITKFDNNLRIAKVKATRFDIHPEEWSEGITE